MHCPRCQAVMTEEQFFAGESTDGIIWMRGWKCTSCEYALNPVEEANRRLQMMAIPDALVHDAFHRLMVDHEREAA